MFIESVFNLLPNSDKKEFIQFLDRKKRKANRKDIDVCNALMNGKEPKFEIANNYHAIRNRIKKDLIKFMSLKQMDNDITETSELINEIGLCRFLLENKLTKIAWGYLIKVENKAIKSKNYLALNNLYTLMLEYASSEFAYEVSEILEKKKEAKDFIEFEEEFLIHLALAKNKLYNLKTSLSSDTKSASIKDLKRLLKKYEEHIYEHPKQVCNYLETLRNTYLLARDLSSIEDIALRLYNNTNKAAGFTKNTHQYKLRMLYIVCHSLYRNKKFKECLQYLNEFKTSIAQYNQSQFDYYYSKIAAFKSAIHFITGNLGEAILTIEKFFENNPKTSVKDNLNLHLSLITFYAYNNEYRKANRIFINFHHTDKWCEKKMGKEWVIRKNLIEMLIQYEMGKDDIALNRINSIIKSSKELFKLNQYQDVAGYLILFKKYIEDQTSVTITDLENAISAQKGDNLDEEVKKISFYCWFKARVSNKDFYKTLMEQLG